MTAAPMNPSHASSTMTRHLGANQTTVVCDAPGGRTRTLVPALGMSPTATHRRVRQFMHHLQFAPICIAQLPPASPQH